MSSIKSHDPVSELLTSQIERKKFLSAYLFSGSDSERKKEVARNFAKALNCEEGHFFEPCTCNSCRKIDSGTHPDVRWYGLDEEERSIKIEAVRDLQNWLNLKPYEGKVKVFVLNEANRMTTEAQNALLKSLEEPPANSVLILLTQKKADLLDTVVSRLTELKVTPYEEREIIDILNREGVGKSDARFLARFSFGNLGYARTLAETSRFKEKSEVMRAVVTDPLNGFERFTSRPRKEVIEFLLFLAAWVRDACVLQSDPEHALLIHEDLLETLRSFSDTHSIDSLFDLYDSIEETRKAIEDNANQKLALARLQIIWSNFLTT